MVNIFRRATVGQAIFCESGFFGHSNVVVGALVVKISESEVVGTFTYSEFPPILIILICVLAPLRHIHLARGGNACKVILQIHVRKY